MSRRGNDLVRRYLWMAALSAVRYNPAVRALYARVVAKHPEQKAIAIGHAMRKLLHLTFAIWKTKKPFDKTHYPWDTPAHVAGLDAKDEAKTAATPEHEQAAGLTLTAEPAQKEVTAACEASLPHDGEPGQHAFVDFAHVKARFASIARVLEHLNLTRKLRTAPGAAKSDCALPHPLPSQSWAHLQREPRRRRLPMLQRPLPEEGRRDRFVGHAAHHQDLRQAAFDQAMRTFALEPAPTQPTEKRHG